VTSTQEEAMRKEIYTEVKKVVNTTGKFLLTQFNKV
jgi:hypothetical protein